MERTLFDKEAIEIEMPQKKFMHIDMKGGKALITFSDTTACAYNLEVVQTQEHSGWTLPVEPKGI